MAWADELEWQRDMKSLLSNFNNMYNRCLVEVGGENLYHMWFFGWAAGDTNPGILGCDAIFHARSKNLKDWEVYSGLGQWNATMSPKHWQPVLYASDRWYEARHVGDPSVVYRQGKYYLAYSTTSKNFEPLEVYSAKMVQRIMGAVSKD